MATVYVAILKVLTTMISLTLSEMMMVKCLYILKWSSMAMADDNLIATVIFRHSIYILDAVTSSGILKAKQKLGVTFHSNKLGGIDFTKFSKLSMCSAGAGRCWLVQWPGLPPRHCTWSVLKFLCRLAYRN